MFAVFGLLILPALASAQSFLNPFQQAPSASAKITPLELSRLTREVDKSPKSFSARMDLGIALGERGQWQLALKQFEVAGGIQANSPEAIYDMGLTKMMMASVMQDHHSTAYYEQLDAAQHTLIRAFKLDPNLPKIHEHLGWLYHQLGDQDSAIQEFRIAAKLNPSSSEVLNNLGTSLAEAQDYGEATRWYEDALTIDPKCVSCAINLEGSIRSAGEEAKALEKYEVRVTRQADSPLSHLLYGMMLTLSGAQQDKAMVELRTALQGIPDLAVAHFYLGEIYHEQQNDPVAEVEYRTAIKMDPGRGSFLEALAVVLLEEDKFKSAEALLQKAVLLDPDNSSLHYKLSRALQRLGSGVGAARERAVASKLNQEEQSRALLQMSLKDGIADLRKGNIPDAVRELRAAFSVDPNQPETNYYLGIALSQAGDPTGSVQAFKRALERRPESAEFHYNFGISLWQYGQASPAIEQFRRATTIRPEYALAHCALGLALLRSGDWEEGQKEVSQAKHLGACAQQAR